MSGRAMIYGATGYTGREIAGVLAQDGVILAGRNAERVRALAQPLGLEWRAFGPDDPGAARGAIAGLDLVLNAAGPFAATALPILEACVAEGAHYLDLNGEWPVFLDLMAKDQVARAAGVMVLPGVGLTIAVTDCLLAEAMRRWPDTVRLRLGISRARVMSRGSMTSAAALVSPRALVRSGGELRAIPAGAQTHAFDFGEGLKEAVAVSWADVATAGVTTGVADIEVYSELGWPQRLGYRAGGLAMAVTGVASWRAASRAAAAAWPVDPDGAARAQAGYVMVVEALDPWRRPRRLRMTTLDGYSASVLTAVAAVRRVLAGEVRTGFQTPGRLFGPGFAFEVGAARLEARERESLGAPA
ncbi:MAG TPA: saccharopine dehydrogenase NADP-binding domain-containing protein [Caulobacteraceae bacterium]|nr:saccharopine dehydrogenase NADP-binding domain-containing protein [Caulobacteraceae bacterium]